MDPDLIKIEEEKINIFFGKKVLLPQPNITAHDFEKFKKLNFHLHFLPKLEIEQNTKFPGWFDPPRKNFFSLIKRGLLLSENARLSGRWILIDGRNKPNAHYLWASKNDLLVFLLKTVGFDYRRLSKKFEKQQYPNDYLASVLKNNGYFSRYSISWQEINEIIKPETANFLSIEKEKIRLPFFLEWNYLANLFYPQWGKTNTWEWFNDRLKTGECLAGGCSSLSVLGWDPPDFWSTILGFRFLIEI